MAAWDADRVAAQRPRIERELHRAGIHARRSRRAAASRSWRRCIRRSTDPRGRWLFDPAHRDARSEWALTAVARRCICASGARSQLCERRRHALDRRLQALAAPGRDVEAFLDRERERYRPQLEAYAALLRALDARPIRLGLYFPLLAGWREWAAAADRLARAPANALDRPRSQGGKIRAFSMPSGPLYRGSGEIERAGFSRLSRCSGGSRCPDHRQLRWRASRPPGDAHAPDRGRRRPRAAADGADLRAASARILRPRDGAAAPVDAARQARALRRARRRAGVHRALQRRAWRGSPRERFIDEVLVRGLGTRWVLVGEDFRFGRGRGGDLALLRAAARSFSVEAMPTVERRRRAGVEQRPCATRSRAASSSVRRACSAGRTRSPGASRTATSAAAASAFPPPTCRCGASRRCPGFSRCGCTAWATRRAAAVASLGVRPTVKLDAPPLLEVFVFDFDQAIYGRRISVEFLHKLRDEERYADLDALRRQIHADVAQARDYFGHPEIARGNDA